MVDAGADRRAGARYEVRLLLDGQRHDVPLSILRRFRIGLRTLWMLAISLGAYEGTGVRHAVLQVLDRISGAVLTDMQYRGIDSQAVLAAYERVVADLAALTPEEFAEQWGLRTEGDASLP